MATLSLSLRTPSCRSRASRLRSQPLLRITALAGCEGTPIDSSADKHTEAVTQSECSTYNAQWETCTITMPDSRRVTCIAHNSNAGISCDWAHADGADKGWTE